MQYKIIARILLILTVCNFVLAGHVATREVRGVTADTLDRGEDVKIVSDKRAQEGKNSNIQ